LLLRRYMSKMAFRFLLLPLFALIPLTGPVSASAASAKSDWIFYTNTLTLFKLEKDDACSIVRVHSIYKNAAGEIFHQEGVGWVVGALRNFGILTPYHVVTQADLVVAECKGKYYTLSKPIVDAERDLSFFKIDGKVTDLVDKILNPLILSMTKDDDFFLEAAQRNPLVQKGLDRQFVFKIPRHKYENYLAPIMLSMANFNIVSPPQGSNPQNSLLSSPVGSSQVTGQVDRDQSYIKNLIRVENFGIRPGLSGSVLFGVPFKSDNYDYDAETKTAHFTKAIETTPRFVLGMVTKTRLNGAETVAISLGDILDFLEEYPKENPDSAPAKRDLEVRYRKIKEQDRERLQAYINLLSPDGSTAEAFEYCSSDYKSSAESVATKNPFLQSLLEKQPLKENEKNLLRYASANAPVRSGKGLNSGTLKSGGGEYGEGGDGFLAPQATFLTSQTSLGNFESDLFSPFLRSMDKTSSFGLYISPTFCKSRGLMVENRLIHGVKLPGQEFKRLLNFEDLRRFQKENGPKTLELLRKHGQTSQRPFFTYDLEKMRPLEVPLQTRNSFSSDQSTWRAGEKVYFKQQLLPAQPELRTSGIIIDLDLTDRNNYEVPWKPGDTMFSTNKEHHAMAPNGTEYLQMAANYFVFKTEIKSPGPLADSRFRNYFELRYAQGKWKSSLSLGQSCRLEMAPEHFTQVNPWRLEYNDGRTKMSVEFMSQDRLLVMSLQQGDCRELKDLALGEVEVFLNADIFEVAGTVRSALVPKAINWSELATKYPTKK
jgi:hypothetical protein